MANHVPRVGGLLLAVGIVGSTLALPRSASAAAAPAPTLKRCVILNGEVVSPAGTCDGVTITRTPADAITVKTKDGTMTTVTNAGPGATVVSTINNITVVNSQGCVIVDKVIISPVESCPKVNLHPVFG
jgi:hypothetical protein